MKPQTRFAIAILVVVLVTAGLIALMLEVPLVTITPLR